MAKDNAASAAGDALSSGAKQVAEGAKGAVTKLTQTTGGKLALAFGVVALGAGAVALAGTLSMTAAGAAGVTGKLASVAAPDLIVPA